MRGHPATPRSGSIKFFMKDVGDCLSLGFVLFLCWSHDADDTDTAVIAAAVAIVAVIIWRIIRK